MARLNVKKESLRTHEGAVAKRINPELQLRRSVMACLLWEDQFYEDGVSIAERISSLVSQVAIEKVKDIAVEAREKMKLRHVPLLIMSELSKRTDSRIAETFERVIQRPDELTEFLAIYWKNGRCSLSAQIKKGLAKAFGKFGEYQLAKYNREGTIKLRDVLFLCHAKPKDKEQDDLWKRLIDNKLETPDTWEVGLSIGGNKKETFERLLKERKLGALALLRNLRNMRQADVDVNLIKNNLQNMKVDRVLPFRFLTAAKYTPEYESFIEEAFYRCTEHKNKLRGKTVLIVDVSGSMYNADISAKSELNRANVACALAVLARELCEEVAIYATAGDDHKRIHATKKVPDRRGFALSDVIYNLCRPLGGGGIFLKQVMDYVGEHEKRIADRVIVITDEQDCDIESMRSPLKAWGWDYCNADVWGKKNYMINVASYKNGIGYDKWTHIDGWSEAVIDYIEVIEQEKLY